MIISNLIKLNLNLEVESIEEKPVKTLGLAGAKPGVPFATFIESVEYIDALNENVETVITNLNVANELIKAKTNLGICIVENPRLCFFKLHNYLVENDEYCLPYKNNNISASCKIGKFSVIANNNVVIEDNVIIEDFVKIEENTVIRKDAIIRSGSIIGGEGFEFKKDADTLFPVKHAGSVVIGENVEIQNNTCVDKAIYPWDRTVIDNYSKIDNFVHVAHGVKIGKCVMVVAHANIGGRVEIDDNTWIGLGAIIRNGLKIGRNARVNMGAVATKNVCDGESVSGNFAINHKLFLERLKK